ncbi:hypothetical protein IFM89_020074 [Coptis chinensis]|uniref:Transcription factor CBF/NF-Y/archaeal histone domain-containing protein n=1 Tax=Coptis chinensis TaxID=261450 RepID=A0A835H7D8_9MAGN|nr:hypothetical protein IFM89_020074 [Coptis chinensis]
MCVCCFWAATMFKIIKEMLPQDVRVARDAQDLLVECCVLGFGDYIEDVYAAYEQHKLETMDSPKAGKWSGEKMTEEEALVEQQRMFAEARARMNGGVNITKHSDSDRSLDS